MDGFQTWGGCGGLNRNSPTGGAANGIPRNLSTARMGMLRSSKRRVFPLTDPNRVFTIIKSSSAKAKKSPAVIKKATM